MVALNLTCSTYIKYMSVTILFLAYCTRTSVQISYPHLKPVICFDFQGKLFNTTVKSKCCYCSWVINSLVKQYRRNRKFFDFILYVSLIFIFNHFHCTTCMVKTSEIMLSRFALDTTDLCTES